MSYAVWVYNKLPHHGAGLSPEELFSGDGKKILKWESRAWQGIFVGFSPGLSSLVPLILNPRTQHISPQYHVIFDDAFSTVPSLATVEEHDQQFEKLFQTTRKSMDLFEEHWLSPSDLEHRQRMRHQDLLRHTPCLRSPSASTSPPTPEGVPPATMRPDPVLPEQIPASTTPPDPIPPPPQ
eukprot:CCRYP_014115-RA/>CCRYP_014115-RA protein AED:0.38 eAED:-0.10 QI:0/0/0/1/1/1/2/0/180